MKLCSVFKHKVVQVSSLSYDQTWGDIWYCVTLPKIRGGTCPPRPPRFDAHDII